MPDSHGDIRPVPDPTIMTTAALNREVAHLHNRINEAVEALKDLHNYDVAAVRSALTELIEHLREIREGQDLVNVEKFRNVDLRFDLIERQRVELKTDNRRSLDTALAGAEANLRNLADTYYTGHTNLTKGIEEAKLRLAGLEAARASGRESSATTYAILGVVLTVIWIAITVLALFHR